MPYRPLAGVRVLDLGILIPSALVGHRLAALGADVVKIEQRGRGDRIRAIPPFTDGESEQFQSHLWGRRSIELDLRTPRGSGDLPPAGRRRRCHCRKPASRVLGAFGRATSGRYARAARTRDLFADRLRADRSTRRIAVPRAQHGRPRRRTTGRMAGWPATARAYPHQLGQRTRIGERRPRHRGRGPVRQVNGEGAWIDVSCWDALVETHRAEIATQWRTGSPATRTSDPWDRCTTSTPPATVDPVLFGALEPKFFERFCTEVGRLDLFGHHHGGAIEFGVGDEHLRKELEDIFATATADEWRRAAGAASAVGCRRKRGCARPKSSFASESVMWSKRICRRKRGPRPVLCHAARMQAVCRPPSRSLILEGFSADSAALFFGRLTPGDFGLTWLGASRRVRARGVFERPVLPKSIRRRRAGRARRDLQRDP